MSSREKRRTIGFILIIVGVFGFSISLLSFFAIGFSLWPSMMGDEHSYLMPMMQKWGYRELEEVNSTVEKVESMEVKLEVEGGEVELHGSPWFWQRIGIKVGDRVTVRGMFFSMMKHGGGWHGVFIPFEITVNGGKYGDVKEGAPVWM